MKHMKNTSRAEVVPCASLVQTIQPPRHLPGARTAFRAISPRAAPAATPNAIAAKLVEYSFEGGGDGAA
eukprot:CAMPEP_0184712886 /NCGR_PEP_ID=MMETSP0314-20130426/3348_1 /TAXON_ID=38298 /ORGANISM="Rhodella maculata, Strain CCMP 736" /LENGTH=68 /DNA_ID=CAMNT_0027175411 /DNA_START=222 /DNA_END=426 /DNA_ORIENTATION=+